MKSGIELISIERKEQIEKHHKSIEDDVTYNSDNELERFALSVITGDRSLFPQYWREDIFNKISKKGRKERLIIAGALIAAEIDRLQAS